MGSDVADWLHSQPRWDGSFQTAPNTIPKNFATETGQSTAYVEGISMVAAAVLAVGCVISLINLTFYVMAWQCGWWGPRASGAEVNGAKLRRRSATACISLWFCSILFLLSILVSWVGTVEFGKAADGTFVAMDELSTSMHSSEAQSRRSQRRSEGTANSANWLAGNLTALGARHNVSAAVSALVNDSITIRDTASSIASAAQEIKTTLHKLHSGIDEVRAVTTEVHHGQRALNFSALGVGLLLGVVFMASTLRFGWCGLVHKGTSCLLLPISTLLWVFASLILVLAFFLADFCVLPDQTGVRLVRGLSASGKSGNATLLIGSADFYLLNCSQSTDPTADGTIALERARGIYGSASSSAIASDAVALAAAELAGNVSALAPILRPLDPSGFDAVLWSSTNLSARAASANLSTWNVLPTLDCHQVRDPWDRAVTATCDVGIEHGFAPLWIGCTAASIFLSLALLLGVPLCSFHPSEAGGSILENLLNPAEATQRPRPTPRERAIPDEYGTVSEDNPIRAHSISRDNLDDGGHIEIPEWGGAGGAAAPSHQVSVSSWASQQSAREERVAKAQRGKVRERPD